MICTQIVSYVGRLRIQRFVFTTFWAMGLFCLKRVLMVFRCWMLGVEEMIAVVCFRFCFLFSLNFKTSTTKKRRVAAIGREYL